MRTTRPPAIGGESKDVIQSERNSRNKVRHAWGYRTAGVVASLIVWQLITYVVPNGSIPSVYRVLQSVYSVLRYDDFIGNASVTLLSITAGFLIAAILGIVLGFIAQVNSWIDSIIQPVMSVGRSVPALIWALLAAIALGADREATVAVVAIAIVPFIVVGCYEGFKTVRDSLYEMKRSFRIGIWDSLRYVYVEGAAPSIIGSLRFGFILAFHVVVIAELFGVGSGVGFEMNAAFERGNVSAILAWAFLFLILLGIVEFGLTYRFRRWFARWQIES